MVITRSQCAGMDQVAVRSDSQPGSISDGGRGDGRRLHVRCGRQGERGTQSAVGGSALMSTAPAVMEGVLRPNLRHWEHVPAAFVVTRASKPELEPCLPKLETAVQCLW
jgi:hypothetical protein